MSDLLKFTYKNYKGETSKRAVRPGNLWFGKTEYHPKEQWFLSAYDPSKDANRDFALNDMVGSGIKMPEPKIIVEAAREWYL